MRRPTLRLAWRKDRKTVELRVTADRRMRRYGLDFACEEGQWNRMTQRFNSTMRGHVAANATLGRLLEKASRTVDELLLAKAWSWDAFDRRFLRGEVDGDGELVPVDVATYIDAIADEMAATDREGNATVYRDCARNVRKYAGGTALLFEGLTMDVLYAMDGMMRRNGAGDGGIGVMMRTLRAAVNRAMKEGLLRPDRYPFATARTRGYEMKMLKRRKVSRALGDEEMEAFKRFPFAKHPSLGQSVRIFLIIYYARGMNFADLAHLRTTDIHGDRIRYQRKKTVRRSSKVLSIPVKGELARLLREVGPGKGGYLLPILEPQHITGRQQMHRIEKRLKMLNNDLQKAAHIVGVKGRVTSYVARHSYAMKLKTSGVDIGKISEAMGHSSVSTTETYLKQFDDRVIDATDELL